MADSKVSSDLRLSIYRALRGIYQANTLGIVIISIESLNVYNVTFWNCQGKPLSDWDFPRRVILQLRAPTQALIQNSNVHCIVQASTSSTPRRLLTISCEVMYVRCI